MRWIPCFAASLCCFLGISSQALGAGCFGLELGGDIRDYAHAPQAVREIDRLKVFEVEPGSPDADFDTYAVDTFDGRIIRIMASSSDDRTSGAEHTLKVCKKLRQELTKAYGDPHFAFDDIDEANEDLLEYLVSNDGVEVLEWTFAERSEKGIGAIYVFLSGIEDENGRPASYCTLYMESPDYAAINDAIRQLELAEPPEQADMLPQPDQQPL
ncbi:MAG: hypothetical protein ACQGQP_04230 [Desulfovibrio sp.]|jgi:hypothetical protein|nr:hypothetical protein [Mailhella sp.]